MENKYTTYEEAMKDLELKVLNIMDELFDISSEYGKWDEWDKCECLDKARFALFEKYEKANFKKHATD